MKNRLVAAILAIFGGIVGAHKFYLRQPGVGFFYFFLFMLSVNAGFPAVTFIFGLIEGIKLLMMSDLTFNKKYNGGVIENDQQQPGNWQERQYRWQERPNNQQRPAQNRGWRNVEVPNYQATRKNIYKESAIRKYKEFDLDGAIEEFLKSLQIEPKDIATHFNLACAYSLTEQGEKAYYHLTKAVEYGFTDYDKINTHDDLAYVRIQPQWDDFKASGYHSFSHFEKGLTENPALEPQNDVLLDQLNKLEELRKQGLITNDEYILEKRRLND
ncbi:MAG: NINE protein [Saprospiraceae bacterium]